jgi:hypothetical protein
VRPIGVMAPRPVMTARCMIHSSLRIYIYNPIAFIKMRPASHIS